MSYLAKIAHPKRKMHPHALKGFQWEVVEPFLLTPKGFRNDKSCRLKRNFQHYVLFTKSRLSMENFPS